MRTVDRLDVETKHLAWELEIEAAALLTATTTADYLRYLTRIYGFIAPLERSLAETAGLSAFLDERRLHKHLLIEADLQTLGFKRLAIQSIPQCMWIPWFEEPRVALGWAYVIERTTLTHPSLFRHVATVLPGEAAFAASFLKVYSSVNGEMWRSFSEGVEAAASTPDHVAAIFDGVHAGYRFFRRWRNTIDGKAVSGFQETVEERPAARPDVPSPPRPMSEET